MTGLKRWIQFSNSFVGWAKARLRRAHHLTPCSRWWARFRLRSSSYGGQVALPTLRRRGKFPNQFSNSERMCVRVLAALMHPRFAHVSPSKKEGAGKAGRRLHPRSCAQEAHEWTTGSTGSIRLSLRDGVTAYFVLSSVTGLFATVDLRNDDASQPGWVDASPQGLTPASGRQDHTTSPSATVSAERSPGLVRSGKILAKAGCSAVRPRAGRSLTSSQARPAIPCAPDAAASTASHPRS